MHANDAHCRIKTRTVPVTLAAPTPRARWWLGRAGECATGAELGFFRSLDERTNKQREKQTIKVCGKVRKSL